MYYYEVIINGKNLAPLTYHSNAQIPNFNAVKISLRNKESLGFILREVTKPSFKTEQILEILPSFLTPIQQRLLLFIASYYTCSLGLASALFEPMQQSQNTIKSQENQNAIKSQNQLICQNAPELEILNKNITLPKLSQLQSQAYEFCQKRDISLIFGDTGSGKSEIYISAIANTLKNGHQALLLMPEIALTPQMQKRLERYFGDSVGVWHSKITPAKKRKLLADFISGKVRLISGARSALFLPFSDLGLIVVDEEHDQSYKSSVTPAYNTRDLAVFLCAPKQKTDFLKPKLILGSATPSATSYHKYEHFRLKGTYFNSQKSFLFDPSNLGLSKMIISHLQEILEQKKQAVVFLPTRANFKLLKCQECGQSFTCPFCSVALSLHKKQNALKCHYCGFMCPIPQACEKCGNNLLEASKIGTSELKLMLEKTLPNAVIAKFDRDEITTAKKLESLLKNFNDQKIDILVGTQMLSKGHDYHNVALAVIMGLDEHLFHCDFRAREKTLALALQIAGRAGRASEGKIIIQSKFSSFFYPYLNDFEEFLKDELAQRNPLYPPFSRLARIIISTDNQSKNENLQNKLVLEFQNIADLEIVGYGKAAIEQIANMHRNYILLRAQNPAPLIKACQIAQNNGAWPDIDPFSFS